MSLVCFCMSEAQPIGANLAGLVEKVYKSLAETFEQFYSSSEKEERWSRNMSLIVYPYKRDPFTGKMEALTKDLQSAGFEAWREQVWGAKIVRSLQCILLPSLEKGDIYAEGADLDQLEAEASLLLQHVELIAARTETTEYRLPKQDKEPDIHMEVSDEVKVAFLGLVQQVGENSLRHRLRNILAAVQTARELGEGHGGVCIG